MTSIKRGDELMVGDTIEVWWKPRRDTIVEFRPHREPPGWYKSLHGTPPKPGTVRVAIFALLGDGMTIFPSDQFEVIAHA